mgnify:CR=1 FL=1
MYALRRKPRGISGAASGSGLNIRKKTDGNLPILCRINACDEVLGGQSIADTKLPNKVRNNQLETLAPCIVCLLGCVPICLRASPLPAQ